jgi:hypothetical protein
MARPENLLTRFGYYCNIECLNENITQRLLEDPNEKAAKSSIGWNGILWSAAV